MQANNPKLLSQFAEDMPLDFLKEVQYGMHAIFKEVHHRVNDDPAWGESEAKDLKPYLRRAMVEKLVRDAANKNGLSAIAKPNCKNTANYTIISSKRFVFTVSHTSARAPIRYAEFRQKNSSLNALLSQGRFEEFDTPETYSGNSDSIYAILIYNEQSIEFAIPDQEGKKWLDFYPLQNLIELKTINNNTVTSTDDKAFPVPKKQAVTQGG